MRRFALLSSMAVFLPLSLAPLAASASVFGSLANFDVVNDTGKDAWGFEIEIEDSSFDHTKVLSIFGLNRSFGQVAGGDPLAVVRYGSVDVFDHARGVTIRYGGNIASGITTPTGVFNTPGESCWPGANPGWAANPCDHFGITTAGSPAKTTYNWLVKSDADPTVLVRHATGIPAVAYKPPADPADPRPLVAVIKPAEPMENENAQMWGPAYWVKRFKTEVEHNIDLGDLLRGDNGNPELELAETEIEWGIFQRVPVGKDVSDELEDDLGLNANGKALIRRYEFYKYTGLTNAEDGEAICNDDCEKDPYGLDLASDHAGTSFVGAYVGSQMAGFNAVQAVPEPETYAMLLAGLGLIGAIARRRHKAA